MTHGVQVSDSEFTIDLDGDDSSANVISRGVARDKSRQVLVLRINGNARCYGHSECDNIVMDESYVQGHPRDYREQRGGQPRPRGRHRQDRRGADYEAHDPRPHRGRSRRADSRRLPEVSPEGGTMSPPSSPPPGAAERSERVLRKKRKKVLTNGTRRAIIIKPTRERPPARPENTASMGVYSSAGRALEWHSRGQRFDPAYLHQKKS